MNNMKKCIILLLIIYLSVIFNSCQKFSIKGRVEIDDYLFVKTCGMDVSNKGSDYSKITVISKQIQIQGMEETKKANILSEEARTIFEANRKMHMYSSKDIFYGHLNFILIGEEAAKEDIRKYLDFVIRDHEARFTASVAIIKGNTAENVLRQTNTDEFFISERLETIFEDAGDMSVSSKVNLAELIEVLDNPYIAVYVPYMKLVDKIEKEGLDANKLDISLEGYAIFKDFKLIGFVEGKVARGINWVRNKVQSGVIIVKDPEGKEVTLELIDSGTKVIPKIIDNKIYTEIKVQMSANISEQEGMTDLFNEKTIMYLEDKLKNAVIKEIQNARN